MRLNRLSVIRRFPVNNTLHHTFKTRMSRRCWGICNCALINLLRMSCRTTHFYGIPRYVHKPTITHPSRWCDDYSHHSRWRLVIVSCTRNHRKLNVEISILSFLHNLHRWVSPTIYPLCGFGQRKERKSLVIIIYGHTCFCRQILQQSTDSSVRDW